ncbi:MAG: dihydroorotate dehydrogenase electron transfer subunit [Ruminococcaceae bacterium]|nr:dihydroorotate dehydrogenase electron transfer subunit [Oscillospiraceae bacterium]
MSDRTREYAVVERHRTLQPSYYELRLRAPVIAGRSRPGQFVFIRVGEGFDPLLRRPISICDADAVAGTITLLYQAVGRGTDWLSHVPEGAQLDLMGPIGTPFPVEGPRAVLVAGGLGIAPLALLTRQLREAGIPVDVYYGARDEAHLFCRDELVECAALHTAAESLGQTVLDILPERLARETTVYACGPLALLAAVQDWASRSGCGGGYVSLEERMACGIGACSGCGFPMNSGRRRLFKKVCVDGPVFPLEEVAFDG